MIRRSLYAVILSLCLPYAAWCGEADVERVTITPVGEATFRFDVTVRHDDTGWDHFANKWDVLAPDGTVVGSRTLFHPHVDEQPFTRSLTNVSIPSPVRQISVRAHCSVHGYGGKILDVKLPH